MLVIIPYVSAYARVTKKGYHKAERLYYLKMVKKQNDCLRLETEALRQPERIEAFAIEQGMKQSQEMAYLRSVNQPRVAQNTDR